MTRTASCSCGQLSITVQGEPAQVLVCHCFECQKQSGGPFLSWSYWPKSAVVATAGKISRYRRIADSGRAVDNYFCPECGSTVYGDSPDIPDEVSICVGSFADPGFPPPRGAVWARDRHGWLSWPADLPEHQTQPD
ncbi:MAG TPA: GFA family protein [Hypericibacter adhaerens]|jgi:hypothetical protein|uniref:Aldehyde-activating protein n=1 Tax=Hypericibacter adhaerens TaxID=2602016 RepID=A0A5J6N1S8_9PROT|nr:GFA family protein [Hypericibacter adhaerens]QEX23661.1 aldehyde-activating protein [Hypericibacter adhaerens]HWA42133.1 GFA family protein [Hypericibacter adhaerens]